jgi:hypothetical protein
MLNIRKSNIRNTDSRVRLLMLASGANRGGDISGDVGN